MKESVVLDSKLVFFVLMTAPVKFTTVMLLGNWAFYIALLMSATYKFCVYQQLNYLKGDNFVWDNVYKQIVTKFVVVKSAICDVKRGGAEKVSTHLI